MNRCITVKEKTLSIEAEGLAAYLESREGFLACKDVGEEHQVADINAAVLVHVSIFFVDRFALCEIVCQIHQIEDVDLTVAAYVTKRSSELAQHNIERIHAVCVKENIPAHRLLNKLGFEPKDERVNPLIVDGMFYNPICIKFTLEL